MISFAVKQINGIRSHIGLPELPEDQPRTMPRPSTSSTSRTSQDSPENQSWPPESLLEHDSRNRDPLPRDELHETAVTTNHDDHSDKHAEAYSAARYKHYKVERDKYRERCAKLEAMLKDNDNRLEQLEQEARDREKEAKKREKAGALLTEEFKRLRAQERIKNDELSMAEQQHEETKRLLKTKVEELEGLQVFTRKTDQVSVADVIDLVKALNAEILQAAAFISDPQHFSSSQGQVSGQDVSKAIKVVKDCLGEEIAAAVQSLGELRKELDPEDPTAVQHALQIAMTGSCEQMIRDWTPVRDANDWLSDMYEGIRATESQAIAGRWRALTRGQVGAKDPSHIMDHFIYYLVNVLIAIGSNFHADVFREIFQEHLTAIVGNIIRIRTNAGESVTSVDLMPYSCRPGAAFRTDCMDDMYGSRGATEDSSKDDILGTTELGLLQREKKTDAAGKLVDQTTPLLKAKVVLESAFRE